MQLTEILGFLTGATCVWLQARENIWNWPIGIANNLFFLVLFFEAKIYADAGLQVAYALIASYGWWQWIKIRDGGTRLPVTRVTLTNWLRLSASTAAITAILFWILARFTDSNIPFWDSLTTALSLTAQFMISRKWIENWWVWILSNVFYIALYCFKKLYLTAFLNVIFIGMCIYGYVQWLRLLSKPSSEMPLATAAGR
jgi:nicotinamide mononucleotide transporter